MAWPCCGVGWAQVQRCVSGLEGAVIMEPPLCLVPLHSVFCRGWRPGTAGLCILCIRGGWLLRGQQPSPNKVVSI